MSIVQVSPTMMSMVLKLRVAKDLVATALNIARPPKYASLIGLLIDTLSFVTYDMVPWVRFPVFVSRRERFLGLAFATTVRGRRGHDRGPQL